MANSNITYVPNSVTHMPLLDQVKDDSMDASDCIAHLAHIANHIGQDALRDELAAMLARVTQIGDELKVAIKQQQEG